MANKPLMTNSPETADLDADPQRPTVTAEPRRRKAPAGTVYGADQKPPEPTTDNWDWQLFAVCRGLDVEIFYHPWGERHRSRKDRIDRAKGICQQCPVISDCARHALEAREPYGIWGGLSEDERADILGRPRRRRPPSGDQWGSDSSHRQDVDGLTEEAARPLARD
jgi:WhiB family redox-sensing transcriptional regulator